MIDFEKEEHVIYEVRKHWLVFFVEAVVLILFALVPLLIITFVFNSETSLNFIEGNIVSLFVFFYALWLLILWVLGMIFWTNYYLDVWIITSKRIIDVEQHGLFKREVSFLLLERIQDVSCHIDGIVPTLLNYGDISVHSAGIQGEFLIKGIPNPNFLNAKINEAIIINKESIETQKYNNENVI